MGNTVEPATASLSFNEACLVEAGIIAAQARDENGIESGGLRYPYKLGKPLVKPKEVQKLTPRLREFHQLYLDESKKGRTMFGAQFKDNDFFHGDGIIWLEFENLFELYQQ